jgi:16S rRNA (adenine1518-N6/adenine1519-N6)-dimethyltransferase
MSAAQVRALLDKYQLRAKKSWGQNFLVDERAYREIVAACRVGADDWVVEIGAGLGTLTARLAEAAGHVIAVERDRDMVAILRAELAANPRIEIAEANALTYDYAAVAERAGRLPTVVGNLPYQIASPLIFRLLEARATIARIVVMLQKEMADRIIAQPGTRDYSALSVMVRMYGEPKLVCRVRAGGFLPAPRVDSAVLQIVPYAGGRARVAVSDREWFSRVVHAAFNQRRKTLRNALRALAGEDARLDAALATVALDGQRRGETLSVEEFARLADALPVTHA